VTIGFISASRIFYYLTFSEVFFTWSCDLSLQLKTGRSIYRGSRSVFTLIEVTKQNVYCELEGDREYRMIYKGPGFFAVE
jgi:hypothetical protein